MKWIGICRHYMGLNIKMLDVGMFDTMFEMVPPSKDLRYSLIKEMIVSEHMKSKEIQL